MINAVIFLVQSARNIFLLVHNEPVCMLKVCVFFANGIKNVSIWLDAVSWTKRCLCTHNGKEIHSGSIIWLCGYSKFSGKKSNLACPLVFSPNWVLKSFYIYYSNQIIVQVSLDDQDGTPGIVVGPAHQRHRRREGGIKF